ncbi:RarD protein [Saprolegnia diclina VS20]|uniref:RarD protein n=1 Tax=Saprolegnia diclina (strain VS20) TaxID=1156394 RepID=T0RUF4_SAPDV|nr:RarD protein [Saprolegnia diclina VS20]EQC33957.1 RarD protein [Saprolegnia diclina VS20]|eukprot:XP_008612752.1 RarD protein [Saprolegnia diclina VS20]
MFYAIGFALVAAVLAGLSPLYWTRLYFVPVLEIVAHAVLWSTLLLLIAIAATGRLGLFANALDKRTVLLHCIANLFMVCNYYLLVYASLHATLLLLSMGYFLAPLLESLLGRVFRREALSSRQNVAILVGVFAAIVIGIGFEAVPVVGLLAAVSMALHRVLTSFKPLPPDMSAALEGLGLIVPAIAYIAVITANGTSLFWHISGQVNGLLLGSGLIVALPLFFVCKAAASLCPNVLQLVGYATPTLFLLLAIFNTGEALPLIAFIGFLMLWMAFTMDIMERLRRTKETKASEILGDAGVGDGFIAASPV